MKNDRRHGHGVGRFTAAAATVLAMGLAAEGLARQQQQQQNQNQNQNQNQRDQNRQNQSQRTQQQNQGRLQLDPTALVRVGYDVDNDGTVDIYEYIFAYDLEQARQSSRTKMQRGAQMGQRQGDQRAAMQREQGQMQQQGQMAQRRTHQVQGTIRDMTTLQIAGSDQRHVVARLETDEGRVARVFLGPQEQVGRLNLQDGDRVTVQGKRGTVDEKGVLMAARVETDGQSVNVRRTQDLNMRRVSGQVLETRTGKFRENRGPDNVFARIRLEDGATTIVNLGPSDQVGNIELDGKKIDLLAHPARVAGKQALVAEQFRVDGRTVTIDWDAARQETGDN